MHRTQIYLTKEQHEELKSLAEKLGQKQSELIRQALDSYLEKKRETTKEELQAGFNAVAGMWAERDDLDTFVDDLRSEWDARLPS